MNQHLTILCLLLIESCLVECIFGIAGRRALFPLATPHPGLQVFLSPALHPAVCAFPKGADSYLFMGLPFKHGTLPPVEGTVPRGYYSRHLQNFRLLWTALLVYCHFQKHLVPVALLRTS